MKIQNRRDFFLGLIFAAVALALLIYSHTQLEVSGLRVVRGNLSPQSYPNFVLYALFFLALVLMGTSLSRSTENSSIEVTSFRTYLKAFVGIALSLIYIFLMELLGYIPASIIMLIAYIIFMGGRNYKAIIPVSIVIPVLLYYFFSKLMHVLLP